MIDVKELANWPGTSRAGRELNLCSQRVRDLVQAGRLSAIQTDLGMLISPESLNKLKRERAESGK